MTRSLGSATDVCSRCGEQLYRQRLPYEARPIVVLVDSKGRLTCRPWLRHGARRHTITRLGETK